MHLPPLLRDILLVLCSIVHNACADGDLPICVVGAGISGLNLARLLEERGHDVQVFEQNPVVGGKIETFRIRDEVMVEMCPLLYTSASQTLIDLIDKYGFSSTIFNSTDRMGFDSFTGAVRPVIIPPERRAQMFDAVKRYIKYQNEYEKQQVLEFPFLKATSDLFVPMADWLKARNLQALTRFFELAITVEGYGDLTEVPALYILRFISPSLMKTLLNFQPNEVFLSLNEGLDSLVNAMASSLKNPVNLGWKLIQVQRNSNTDQTLTFALRNGGTFTGSCQNVILAFPPLLPYLNPILIDLQDFEREVLDTVQIHKYTSGAHHIPSLHENVYSEAFRKSGPYQAEAESNPPGIGEVVGFVRQSSKSLPDVYSSYSWIKGDFSTTCTDDDFQNIKNNLASTLRKISGGATVTTFRLKTSAQYFPHVSTSNLERGFYAAFDSMQGRGGLYYATTLLRFESMDSALVMTKEFVSRYFNSSSLASVSPSFGTSTPVTLMPSTNQPLSTQPGSPSSSTSTAP